MRVLFVFLALASLALASNRHPSEPYTARERAQRFRDGVILAKPHARLRATIDVAEAGERVRLRERFSRLGDLRVLELEDGESVPAAVARLQATGLYEFVEPDYLEFPDATPNDTGFPSQWSLHNTGQLANGTPGADIRAPAAWDIIREAPGVVVAVIDNGINTGHRDIAANLWRNPSPTFGDVNGAAIVRGVRSGNIADQTGHGSHVAGIIGAVGNNTFNIAGIAWRVQLMALKNSDATGTSSASDSAACVDYAVAKGAHLINCSFGGGSFSQTFFTALRAARDAGVIVVASAGNDSSDNDSGSHFPSNYLLDNIVSVGNSGPGDLPSLSSAFGGLVDLHAPGTSILSLDLTATGQVARSGTSMSAPHVTGALALLRARFPDDTYRQLITRLYRGAVRLPAFTGRSHTGARLDLLGAVTSTTNRPFNDTFAERAVIVGSGTTLRTHNGGATADPGEPAHAGPAAAATLWWQWTAPANGNATLSTAGSAYDTVLAVYSGTALGTLVPVAANDDSAGLATSQLVFPARLGVTYQIAVGGKAGASGLTVLNIGTAPANDDFARATALASVPSLQAAGTTFHASTEPGEPRVAGQAGGGSVWYKWVAPRAGRFQVAAFTTAFDTLLGVYTGPAVDRLALVADSNDTGIDNENSDSLCTLAAVAGTTYYFKVDCADPQTRGEFTLTVTDSAWQFSTVGNITGAPAVAPDGTVYFGGGTPDFHVYAVDADGRSKWRYRAPGTLNNASPAVGADGTVFFGTSDGTVTALKPDGTRLWARALGAGSVSVSPALGADGTVYLHGTDGFLYALNPATGDTFWRVSVLATTFASAVVAPDGTIYQPSASGYLYAVRPDGTVKWRFFSGDDTFATPALDSAGNIYFTTYTLGLLFCVTPEGTMKWSFSPPAFDLASGSPTLTADESAVIFGSLEKQVYAVNTADGSLRWATTLGEAVLASTPAIDAAGNIYVGCYDHRVYLLDAQGVIQRRWDTALPIRSSPALVGRRLYIGSGDAKLYAFDLDAGPAAGTWTQYRRTPDRRGRLAGPTLALTYPPAPRFNSIATQPLVVSAAASGPDPLAFQWLRDGVAVPGATQATFARPVVAATDAGTYTLRITAGSATVTSSPVVVTVAPLDPPRIGNFSIIAAAGSGSQALVVGFHVVGSAGKPVLLRGVGPTLASFGVGTPLADPALVLFAGNTLLGANDTWDTDPGSPAAIALTRAFPLPAGSRDAAITRTLAPGRYAVELVNAGPAAGTALLELYEADPLGTPAATLPRFNNLSARGPVGTGQNFLAAGFTVVGNIPRRLLIRAIGPTLSSFGITGALADPILDVYRGNTLLARNDEWSGTAALTAAFAEAGAFAIPATSTNSALIVTLVPGVYSARVTGFLGATGIALLEIYELP